LSVGWLGRFALLALLSGLFLGSASAIAQPAAAFGPSSPTRPGGPAAATAPLGAGVPAAAVRSDDFEPVRPSQAATIGEQIPARWLVAAAYGLIWMTVFGLLIQLQRRQRLLKREMEELASRLPPPGQTPGLLRG
jgi:hypothetical protein